MTEQEIVAIVGEDHATGTEVFRDTLLARCLEVLGSDADAFDLPDDELEMLAAAGDSAQPVPEHGNAD